MAKKVYFCFDYQDVIDFRANVVRQHWMTKPDRETAGFFDKSIWETAQRTNSTALKRLINGALEGTSVTCVLIGTRTFARPWVRYEILKSLRRGNRLLGVHINSIRGKDQGTKPLGSNPFDFLGVTYAQDGSTATLWEKIDNRWVPYSEIEGGASYSTRNIPAEFRGNGFNLNRWYKTYDWVSDIGYNNFATWVA